MQAATSELRLSGYCCGVVSCFSTREPTNLPCSTSRRTPRSYESLSSRLGVAVRSPRQSAQRYDTGHDNDDAEYLVSAEALPEEEEGSDSCDRRVGRCEDGGNGKLLTSPERIARQAADFAKRGGEDERKGSQADSQPPPDQ